MIGSAIISDTNVRVDGARVTARPRWVVAVRAHRSAQREFWIVDNGSFHAGQASIDRMTAQHSNAVLAHLPVHASWLNQVECYFSILQRKAIAAANFTDLDHLAQRVLAFQDRTTSTLEPSAGSNQPTFSATPTTTPSPRDPTNSRRH